MDTAGPRARLQRAHGCAAAFAFYPGGILRVSQKAGYAVIDDLPSNLLTGFILAFMTGALRPRKRGATISWPILSGIVGSLRRPMTCSDLSVFFRLCASRTGQALNLSFMGGSSCLRILA